MTITYKVPRSQRPIWLLKCIAEFKAIIEESDSKDDIISKLNECLDRQYYEKGGGGGQYTCRMVRRFVAEDNNSIYICSATGKRLLCEIILN